MEKGVSEITPQQIGGIVTSIKKGTASYTYFARKYNTSVGRIKRICKKHGVQSIHEEPEQLKAARENQKKGFWDRLLGR